jgi:UDP-glucose 4-epimerase
VARVGNLDAARAAGRVTLVQADIRDREALQRAMAGIDVLFHLAAIRLTQCAEFPRLALEVMVDGTFNVVECAVEAGVAKTVVASSASIYGMAERFPTDESHPPYDNNTLYGAAKLFGEGLLRSTRERSGLDYVALAPVQRLRPADGHRRRLHRGAHPLDGAHRTRTRAGHLRRRRASRWTSCTSTTSRAHSCLPPKPTRRARCSTSQAASRTSLSALARALIAAMGAQVGVEHGPERKFTAVPRRWADTRRARERLGFEAAVGLDEGLARLISWWRAHADAPRAGEMPAGAA